MGELPPTIVFNKIRQAFGPGRLRTLSFPIFLRKRDLPLSKSLPGDPRSSGLNSVVGDVTFKNCCKTKTFSTFSVFSPIKPQSHPKVTQSDPKVAPK